MSETIGIEYRVLGVEKCTGSGRLLAVASVLVVIADVELVLQGCQVRLSADGRYIGGAPRWRHPRTAEWLPCVVLPEPLATALGQELTNAMEELI